MDRKDEIFYDYLVNLGGVVLRNLKKHSGDDPLMTYVCEVAQTFHTFCKTAKKERLKDLQAAEERRKLALQLVNSKLEQAMTNDVRLIALHNMGGVQNESEVRHLIVYLNQRRHTVALEELFIALNRYYKS